MTDIIYCYSKNVFGSFECDALQHNPTPEEAISLLNILRDKLFSIWNKDGKGVFIDYVILYKQSISGCHFAAKLTFGNEKQDLKRFKRSIPTRENGCEIQIPPFVSVVRLHFLQNPFGRAANPIDELIKTCMRESLPYWKYDHFAEDKSWNLSTMVQSLHHRLLTCTSQAEAKELIRDNVDAEELEKVGVQKLKIFDSFATAPRRETFSPPPFAKWGFDALDALKPHRDACTVRTRGKCKPCLEYMCWYVIKTWYDQVFCTQDKMGVRILNDLTEVERKTRKRALVVRGSSESAKSVFFENLCHGDERHFLSVKGSMSRDNTRNVDGDIWLYIFDDFTFKKEQHQMLKGILASDGTTLDGKWVSKALPRGIPCVVLVNDRTQLDIFKADKDLDPRCIYVDMEDDMYLGPPKDLTKVNEDLDYNGPKTCYSNENSLTIDTFAIMMSAREEKGETVPLQVHRALIEKYRTQCTELNKLKLQNEKHQKECPLSKHFNKPVNLEQKSYEPSISKKIKAADSMIGTGLPTTTSKVRQEEEEDASRTSPIQSNLARMLSKIAEDDEIWDTRHRLRSHQLNDQPITDKDILEDEAIQEHIRQNDKPKYNYFEESEAVEDDEKTNSWKMSPKKGKKKKKKHPHRDNKSGENRKGMSSFRQ